MFRAFSFIVNNAHKVNNNLYNIMNCNVSGLLCGSRYPQSLIISDKNNQISCMFQIPHFYLIYIQIPHFYLIYILYLAPFLLYKLYQKMILNLYFSMCIFKEYNILILYYIRHYTWKKNILLP